jgi:hypothetical protein
MKTMLRRPLYVSVVGLMSLGSIACGSKDDGSGATDQTLDDTNNGGSGGSGGDAAGGSGGEDPTNPDTNDCGIESGYPGDEFCLLPPDPSEGIQLHVGPADYDDPTAVAPFLIEGGQENVICFNDLAEDGDFYYFAQENRMRSGSHHMLIGLHPADGLSEGPVSQCDQLTQIASVPGSQTPIRVFPGAEVAPEDEGLGRYFPDNVMAQFQLHYVNTGSDVAMREAWVNLFYKDQAEVTDKLNAVFLVGDFAVNVLPGTRDVTTLGYTPNLPTETRIYELVGHMHAHTERFTVWRTQSGVRGEQLYETFNWSEPTTLTFNSVTTNPASDPTELTDGGHTGLLYLQPGEGFEWECEVNNTTDAPLNFANEAYTAEMCLLAGGYVSDTSGLLTGGCTSGSCFNFGN